MIYIASPYSSPGLPTVQEQRYQAAVKFAGLLISQGLPAFSPIAYFHPFSQAYKLPGDAQFWHNTNMRFLRGADAIFLLRLPGWEQSKGVTIELNIAKALGIPRSDFGPDFNPIQ